jgi:Ca2+-binding RTX toxin-like protein
MPNVIRGTNGPDTMLSGTPQGDLVNLFAGNDIFFALRGNDVVLGGDDDDVIAGDSGLDQLLGEGGADFLIGGGDNDRLDGGGENDVLDGGFGSDILTGGARFDRFDFNSILDSEVGLGERNIITDFTRNFDRIDLSSIGARSSSAGNQSFEFVGADAFTGEGQVRTDFSGATGNLVVEANTGGGLEAEFQIEVAGVTTLSQLDFIL